MRFSSNPGQEADEESGEKIRIKERQTPVLEKGILKFLPSISFPIQI